MAVYAAYSGLAMRRPLEIRMGRGMALQAFFIDSLRGRFAELEDLCRVAACFDMLFAWSVAALAGDSLAAMQQRQA